ncbi:TonB-dependent receptor [Bordetella genomosp. 5]|uniref:TonB-dependent receptor n=1 Tax=Bordetella genomosp. 5 TaxID=1395608 RepID=UPI0020CFE143|nr:TonB-dependent receptor [Bordetella genomosp. 5]
MRTAFVVLSMATGLTAGEAWAEEKRAAPSSSTATLAPIEVSGQDVARELLGERDRVTLDSTGLPAAMTVITPAELQTINVGRDISNIFRRVPGVVANNIDQGDTGNGFRMRGFATQGTHGADTAVYVDGVPQNLPSSEAGAGHGPAFLEWLTPDMIGNVAVIKGPVSALYGDQHRAGAVDISSPWGQVPSSIGLTVESYGGRRASLVHSGEYKDIQSLFVADVYRADSYRDEADTERQNFFWKLSTPYDGGRYSLSVNHYHARFHAAGYLLQSSLQSGAADFRDVQYDTPGFGRNTQTGLVFNRRPLNSEAGFYTTVYAQKLERERGIAAAVDQHNVGSDDRYFAGGRVANNFVFGDRGALFVGADFRRDKGDGIRQRYVNGDPTDNYLVNLNMDLVTYGVFAQGQYKPTENLKLLAGLRYDAFDYDIENRKLPDASTKYRDSVATPKLGVVWSALPTLDLYANVAEGFRSPAAQQISPSGTLGPLGARGGAANTSIAPSKVRSYDLGFTASPSENLAVAGAVYYTENEDEIVLTAPDTYSSVGETTRKGFELEARWRATRGFSVYASYGRILEAEIKNPLPGTGARLSVPKDIIKAGVEYGMPLAQGHLTLNADAYLTRGIPYYSGSPLAEKSMPTYTRYDFRVTYDYQRYQMSAYWILQPHRYASEAAYATNAGLWISPQPKNLVGVNVRYFF